MNCPMYALHFWRQRSSHQNDHQRRKFCEETRSQNPQSCVGLVVCLDQFGPQNPNPLRWLQTTNSLTCWRKVISHVMNGVIFFVCSTSWISPCFLAVFFFQLKIRMPCRGELRKEGKEKSLWWRNQGQWVWCQEVWVWINLPCCIRVHQTENYRMAWNFDLTSTEKSGRDRSETSVSSSQACHRDNNHFPGTERSEITTNLEISNSRYIEKVFTTVR